MKRLFSSLIGTLSLLVLAAMPIASAATWEATISQLPTYTTTHNFNVQYTVLSTQPDTFDVQLMQKGPGAGDFTPCGAIQHTSDDPHATNGNSGTVPACVSAEGNYSFEFVVNRNVQEGTDSQTTAITSTTVDTVAPGAPSYHGKTQSGNTYTLSFTAPGDSDVTHVQIFTSTGKTYPAGDSTRVGDVTVSPNQDRTFTYTAPDGATRYFAIEAFDAAGNGSPTVGDPGTVVNPVRFVSVGGQGGGGGAGAGTATTSTTTGQVQGASTTAPNTTTGQVNAPGSSNNSKNNGKVLGAATVVNHNNKTAWIASISGAVALILLALYYWVWPHWHKNP